MISRTKKMLSLYKIEVRQKSRDEVEFEKIKKSMSTLKYLQLLEQNLLQTERIDGKDILK